MSEAIEGLEPRPVWELFARIAQIPRESKNESAIRAFFEDRAREAGLESQRDDAGNLVIRIPATAGCENAPTVVLQGHMDMVCTKNSSVSFDFATDPISLVRAGQYIRADGTTLGADNGIGIAAALAVATAEGINHGPLEILLTVDEETGLTGAFQLSPDLLTGRILLNLDSEEIGIVYMGCAGGSGADTFFAIDWQPPTDGTTGARLEISGLRGGHSGGDIHENRGNAVKLLARTLHALEENFSAELGDFNAGDKHNAIPREANARLTIPAGSMEKAKALVQAMLEDFRKEFSRDTDLTMSLAPTGSSAWGMDHNSTRQLLDMLLAFPNGVLAMSQDLPGLVETSNNLALVKLDSDRFVIHNSPRSSQAIALRAVMDQIQAITRMAGAEYEEKDAYPGWQPNPDSRILNLVEEVHEQLFNNRPERRAIHAGLECGLIGEKFEGMDMVSFGPEIINPHSPDEAVNIASVETFYKHLVGVIEAIAQGAY